LNEKLQTLIPLGLWVYPKTYIRINPYQSMVGKTKELNMIKFINKNVIKNKFKARP
jgi:hypothetical protein